MFISCSSLKYLEAFDGFKNKPKKVEFTTFRLKYIDSLAKEERRDTNIYFYDSKGRRIKETSFLSDGSPVDRGSYYSYDKYGNKIQYTFYNIDGITNIEINYKYNKYGQLIEKEDIRNGKKSITRYNFDRMRRLCNIIGTNRNGSFKENAIRKYDEMWREIELISYDSKGNQESRYEFKYDERGNKYMSKWYNSKNELSRITKKIFNQKKDSIWVEAFSMKGRDTITVKKKKLSFVSIYDKNNNIIEERLFGENGKPSWIIRINYKY